MKNLFGFQKNEKVKRTSGFLIKRQSVGLEERLIDLEEETRSYSKPLIILKTLFTSLSAIGLILLIRLLIKDPAKLFTDNLIKTIVALSLLIVGFFIIGPIVICLYLKSVNQTTRTLEFIELEKEAMAELGIPDSAITIDIYHSPIKFDLNGNEKINTSEMKQYINMPYKAYTDNENLYLSDLKQIIALPLNNFKEIEKVNVKSFISKWNKEDKYNSEKYNLKRHPFGITLNTYYSIIMNDDLYFNVASYDILDLNKLLHLKIKE